MTARKWWLAGLVVFLAGLAGPPLILWWYEGPRSGQLPDGSYTSFMRHEGEVALELSSRPPGAEPLREELRAATEIVERATRTGEHYRDYAWATTAGGYTVANTAILNRPESRWVHVWNPSFVRDARVLDPEAPEALVYFNPGSGRPKELVGIMFMAPMGQHGPQPGGNLTRWHLHQVVEFCQDRDGVPMVAARRGTRGGCPDGTTNGPTPEMLHVWLIDNPHGAFAHRMSLPGEAAASHHGSENVYREFLRRGARFVAARFGGSPPHGGPVPDETAHLHDHPAPSPVARRSGNN